MSMNPRRGSYITLRKHTTDGSNDIDLGIQLSRTTLYPRALFFVTAGDYDMTFTDGTTVTGLTMPANQLLELTAKVMESTTTGSQEFWALY